MSEGRLGRTPLWLWTCGVSVAPMVAIAMGRFGYTLVLPAMTADLGWSYGLAGGLNSAMAVGYLAGALTTTPMAARRGVSGTVVVGVVCATASLMLSGCFTNPYVLMLVRFVAGASGAWAFVGGAELVGRIVARERAPQGMVGLYFGGVGLGLVLSGALVPQTVEHLGWRAGWWLMGALSGAALVPVLMATRLAERRVKASAIERTGLVPAVPLVLLPTMVAYFLFGLGYIAYMTFAVALVREGAVGEHGDELLWCSLGVGALVVSFVWPRLFTRFPGRSTLAILLVADAGGTSLLVAGNGLPELVGSALVVGGCLTGIVGAVTMVARQSLPDSAVLSGLSGLTVVFAVGQFIGPTLFGAISDVVGLTTSLWLSAAVLFAAGMSALAQRPAV